MNIQTDLFAFAYIPSWFDQLDALAEACLPEPWRFRSPTLPMKNTDTPILERYIKLVFHKQAVAWQTAENPYEADRAFFIRNETACFHTGLFSKNLRGIYMCFERNKRKNTMSDWFFLGWADETSPLMRYVEPLPLRPSFLTPEYGLCYFPEWEIRVNVDHILKDGHNVARLPESVQGAWNLPLLLETAVELGRRKAIRSPSLVVPQVYQDRLQYLMPIHLTNMARPDLAMALSVMDGYYYGHTCLMLDMAYLNARLFAQPTAPWLAELVYGKEDQEGGEECEDDPMPSVQGKAV